MRIRESQIEEINKVLADQYGIDSDTGRAVYRIAYCDDQFEKRHGTWTDVTSEGIFVRQVTETRETQKYPWLKDRYILENLVLLTDDQMGELPVSRFSYEPIWIFEDKEQNYLPPALLPCQFVIDTILAVKGKSNLARYKDTTERMLEEQETRRKQIYEGLFGDETSVGDALAHGEGVSVPSNYETEH